MPTPLMKPLEMTKSLLTMHASEYNMEYVTWGLCTAIVLRLLLEHRLRLVMVYCSRQLLSIVCRSRLGLERMSVSRIRTVRP